MVTARRGNDLVTRNSLFFKKVNPPGFYYSTPPRPNVPVEQNGGGPPQEEIFFDVPVRGRCRDRGRQLELQDHPRRNLQRRRELPLKLQSEFDLSNGRRRRWSLMFILVFLFIKTIFFSLLFLIVKP